MIKRNLEPDYEAALALIQHMSDEDLKELVNNDEKVDEIIKGCEQCRDLETEKDLIMAQNKSLAEYNLSLLPQLESGKAKLKELCDSVQTLQESVEQKQAELKNHAGNMNGDTVLALLQAAAAESEEGSEKIAEKFYQKEIEIDEFLEQFQACRKQMHLRRVKADKLSDILNTKKNEAHPTPSKGPAPNLPYPVPSVPYPTSSIPYPIGGINMPYIPGMKTNRDY